MMSLLVKHCLFAAETCPSLPHLQMSRTNEFKPKLYSDLDNVIMEGVVYFREQLSSEQLWQIYFLVMYTGVTLVYL